MTATTSDAAERYEKAVRDFEAYDDGGWMNPAQAAHLHAAARIAAPIVSHSLSGPFQMPEPRNAGPVRVEWLECGSHRVWATFVRDPDGYWVHVDGNDHPAGRIAWSDLVDAPFMALSAWRLGQATELIVSLFAQDAAAAHR